MARTKLNPDQIPLITPDSDWKLPTELPALRNVKEFAIDTENKDEGLASGRGPGWALSAGHVAGVSMAWREGDALRKIYVPLRHPDTNNFDKDNVSRWLCDMMRGRRAMFFNAGYDVGWLQEDLQVRPPALLDDAACQAVLIDENRYSYSLDDVAQWRGVPGKNEQLLREAAIAYGFAGKDVKANMWRMPARYVGPYAEDDALATLLLVEDMRPEIARQGLMDAYQTEMDLVPAVHEMRRRGIRINTDRGEQLCDDLRARGQRALDELGVRLKSRVGMDEVRSHNWLLRVFSQENVEFNSKGDKASFEKDWMRQGYVGRFQEGKSGHWLPQLIAEAKQCFDSADKFVQGFLLDFTHRGRIHASINQFRGEEGGTRSHRFSYSDPPLQQMPSRGEMFLVEWTLTEEIAKAIRSMFEPEEGELWFSPDYSQQEYRLIVRYAEILKCAMAREAGNKYRSDPKTDFHNLVVEMTGLTRRKAKDVNFAKAFGAGIPKFADMTGMTLEEAQKTMGQYDEEMPFVKELGQKCEKAAQHRGFIKMVDGARNHFDFWEAAWVDKSERDRGWREKLKMAPCSLEEAQERAKDEGHPWHGKRLKRAHTHKAMNRLIQGSAARQMKRAMAQCWKEGLVPMLQMHDELSFSMTDPKSGARVVEIMKNSIESDVPFLVDAEWGVNWGDAKHDFKTAKRKLKNGEDNVKTD